MYTLLLGTLALSPAQPPMNPASHEALNPLYKSLLDPGLTVGKGIHAKFPLPSMQDGMTPQKQKDVILGLIGTEYSIQEFARKSIVAPQLIKIRNVSPSDPGAPSRGVDVWFVTYGDLNAVEDEKFLNRLVSAGRGEGKGVGLTKQDLAARNITLADEKHEGFGFIEFDFLEKVRLKTTGRAYWSKTAESAVIAGEIDPRFQNDKQFPNQWQSITKQSGALQVGPVTPWNGAAFYLKITKLSEPVGALFIEEHIIFAEPTGWFDGANLLGSKLPIAVQTNVRNIRKEWAKQGEK